MAMTDSSDGGEYADTSESSDVGEGEHRSMSSKVGEEEDVCAKSDMSDRGDDGCYELSFALLYTDTSDCLLSSFPHPLIGLLYFYDLILLPPVLYDTHLVLRYDLSCTIHIYEPLIRLLVVLGEFRFPST